MKVTLLSYTESPEQVICNAIGIMKEKEPIRFRYTKTREEMIREILKTRLMGALEFASFEFYIEGVSRAFTHQLVRHRTFHFSQQSMRFYDARNSGFRMPNVRSAYHIQEINDTVNLIKSTYEKLVESGCPTEDARSILPTNILTNIMFGATYRGLIDLAEVRMCLQTQDEFREVMLSIKSCVTEVSTFLGQQLMSACDRRGGCEFKSIYDRPCVKRMERELNLCDTCAYVPPSCNAENIKFGNGVGNDNVIKCGKYQTKQQENLNDYT